MTILANTLLRPSCPRCGYDLSGQAATWNHERSSACPLAGVCSECGAEMDWREAFTGQWARVPGFFEHAPWWRMPDTALRTLSWVVVPWRFWGRVRLADRVRLGPLLLWLPVLVSMAYILDAVMQCVITLAYRLQNAPVAGESPLVEELRWCLTTRFDRARSHFESSRVSDLILNTPPMAVVTVIYGLCWPAFVVILSKSRERAGIHRKHVARAWVYSFVWIILPLARWFLDDASRLFALLGPPHSMMSPPEGPELWLSDSAKALGSWSWTRFYPAAWLSLWWYFALGRGLRMDRPLVTWAILQAAVLLTVLALVGLWLAGRWIIICPWN